MAESNDISSNITMRKRKPIQVVLPTQDGNNIDPKGHSTPIVASGSDQQASERSREMETLLDTLVDTTPEDSQRTLDSVGTSLEMAVDQLRDKLNETLAETYAQEYAGSIHGIDSPYNAVTKEDLRQVRQHLEPEFQIPEWQRKAEEKYLDWDINAETFNEYLIRTDQLEHQLALDTPTETLDPAFLLETQYLPRRVRELKRKYIDWEPEHEKFHNYYFQKYGYYYKSQTRNMEEIQPDPMEQDNLELPLYPDIPGFIDPFEEMGSDIFSDTEEEVVHIVYRPEIMAANHPNPIPSIPGLVPDIPADQDVNAADQVRELTSQELQPVSSIFKTIPKFKGELGNDPEAHLQSLYNWMQNVFLPDVVRNAVDALGVVAINEARATHNRQANMKIRHMLFSLSLQDKAQKWYHQLPPGMNFYNKIKSFLRRFSKYGETSMEQATRWDQLHWDPSSTTVSDLVDTVRHLGEYLRLDIEMIKSKLMKLLPQHMRYAIINMDDFDRIKETLQQIAVFQMYGANPAGMVAQAQNVSNTPEFMYKAQIVEPANTKQEEALIKLTEMVKKQQDMMKTHHMTLQNIQDEMNHMEDQVFAAKVEAKPTKPSPGGKTCNNCDSTEHWFRQCNRFTDCLKRLFGSFKFRYDKDGKLEPITIGDLVISPEVQKAIVDMLKEQKEKKLN